MRAGLAGSFTVKVVPSVSLERSDGEPSIIVREHRDEHRARYAFQTADEIFAAGVVADVVIAAVVTLWGYSDAPDPLR